MLLVDAGPLVALMHRDDRHHERCVAVFQTLREPLATVWPALTEAMYLLSFSFDAQDALWEWIDRGVLHLLPLEGEDIPRMRVLMRKDRDLPMDLADAALVCMAERHRLRRIFTLDRRDFGIYKPLRLGRFTVLP